MLSTVPTHHLGTLPLYLLTGSGMTWFYHDCDKKILKYLSLKYKTYLTEVRKYLGTYWGR